MVDAGARPVRTVLLSGGTGFIGRHLCRCLVAAGWQVVVWRHRRPVAFGDRGVSEIARLDQIPAEQRIDAVVNLAGTTILGMPWTGRRRRALLESRLATTGELVGWLAQRPQRAEVLVSASAVGFYGVRGTELLDETAAAQPIFQSELCQKWESSTADVAALGMRWVALRFGVVLGTDGGALPQLVRPARIGLGAVLGDGRQGFPWIHVDDATRLVMWAIDRTTVAGAVNAVSPGLVSQREFQQVLSEVLGRRLMLQFPGWPLRVALGEMSQLLLDGQYVVPVRALQGGFRFDYSTLRPALQDLL
ncbi:MAG: TIGR01777 family oxidoreductase [Steroidobacteraceae bacterium]